MVLMNLYQFLEMHPNLQVTICYLPDMSRYCVETYDAAKDETQQFLFTKESLDASVLSYEHVIVAALRSRYLKEIDKYANEKVDPNDTVHISDEALGYQE